MSNPRIEDYRWLVSPGAEPLLAAATDWSGSLTALTKHLRKDLSAERTHLVLEQIELRKRASAKFQAAASMFFTRKLLEQATDERIATYKTERFPQGSNVADMCCGIGGDLLALARRGPCLALDRDPIALVLAEANCRQTGDVRFEATDVESLVETLDIDAWHIDPDRRVSGSRTSRVEFSDPGRDTLLRLVQRCATGAIKLAPAADLDDELAGQAECEWISSRRECRQQVAWFGELARQPGTRSATAIDSSGLATSLVGAAQLECELSKPGRYLFDADPAVIAAGLLGALARAFHLTAVSPGAAYLTADARVMGGLLACFEIAEVLPFDVKRLRRLLRDRQIGRLEIKVRGAKVHPETLRKQLQPRGPQAATILIFSSAGSTWAALAKRLVDSGD